MDDTDSDRTDMTDRPLGAAVMRGMAAKCPICGSGALFSGYLAVRAHCAHCGGALHHQRADDAPPYFTIFIVGHVLVPLALALELAVKPPLWVHAALWMPLALIACIALLRPIKGGFVGLQWALAMHGFSDGKDANTAPRWEPVIDPSADLSPSGKP